MTENQISYDLSFKIGDPVATGVEDGRLFTRDDRIRFINQALSKLYMLLKNIQRDYRPYWVDVIKVADLNLGLNNGSVYLNGEVQLTDNTIVNIYFTEILQVYPKYNYLNGSKMVEAQYIKPEDYLSIKNGLNDVRKPDESKGQIYWTMIDKVLKLLPNKEIYTTLSLSYKPDTTLIGQGDTLPLPDEYRAIVTLLSASEAMLELNNQNRYQAYSNEVMSLINLISQSNQLKEAKDGL